jgi:hypothetical protein
MDGGRGSQIEGPKTLPATSAAAELSARIDEVVRSFEARVPHPLPADTLQALRAEVLELARAHAARTVLETVTARYAARHPPRPRRPWGCRPRVRRP